MDVVELTGGGLRLAVVPLGAAIQALHLDGVDRPLILGHADPEAYRTDANYLGAVTGRFANRIGGGSFVLDGHRVELDRNEGANTLHGGSDGFHRRLWRVDETSPNSVRLALTSPAGDQGFPGTLQAWCRYTLFEPATIVVELSATTDAPTVVSLAQHVYWNLDAPHTIDDHHLHVRAEHVLATDAQGLPTSIEPAPTLGILHRRVLDHNFCLADQRRASPAPAAALEAAGVRLHVATTEPGLQVYTGEHLQSPFRARQGLCLEAQAWPDAPNRPDFPSARLDPGGIYRQVTVWRLQRVG